MWLAVSPVFLPERPRAPCSSSLENSSGWMGLYSTPGSCDMAHTIWDPYISVGEPLPETIRGTTVFLGCVRGCAVAAIRAALSLI